MALGIDWVRVKFKCALGRVLSWYVSILVMITYRKVLEVAEMKGGMRETLASSSRYHGLRVG